MAKKIKPGRRPTGKFPKVRVMVTIDRTLLDMFDAMAGSGHRSEKIEEAIQNWIESNA